MKRLAFALLFAWPLMGQTPVTVTGLVTDAGNNPATSGFVQFDIQPKSSSIHYFVSGNNLLAPQSTKCSINGSGQVQNQALSGPCQVWGNDVITPGNTQYKVTFAPGGNISNAVNGECITGANYSLNSPVFCPIVGVNPQQTIIRANPFATNIIPVATSTFNIGSPTLQYGAIYASAFFANGIQLTPLPFGLGTNNTWTGTNTFNNTVNLNLGGNFSGTFTGNPTLSGLPAFTHVPGPFTVLSNAQVANLNASLLGGLSPPSSVIVGISDTQILTNKTFDISLNTLKTATNTAAHVPRNNGTQYVDAQLAAADLSNGTTGSGAVVLATSPVISSPTVSTPVINGASTGTGVQGTDTKLLTSGTISGTSAALCTDANGGATTSSCTGVLQSVNSTTTTCPTAAAAGSTCTFTITWGTSFADNGYTPACIGGGTITGFPFIQGWSSKTASALTVVVVNGTANEAVVSGYSEMDCIGRHP